LEKRIDLDLSGDKTKLLSLRKVETETKDEIRESLAIFISGLDAKRTISSAYCEIFVSE